MFRQLTLILDYFFISVIHSHWSIQCLFYFAQYFFSPQQSVGTILIFFHIPYHTLLISTFFFVSSYSFRHNLVHHLRFHICSHNHFIDTVFYFLITFHVIYLPFSSKYRHILYVYLFTISLSQFASVRHNPSLLHLTVRPVSSIFIPYE